MKETLAEAREATGSPPLMTTEEFTTITANNVAGVVFSRDVPPFGGYIQVLPDEPLTVIDAFDPATWNQPKTEILRRYRVILNPGQNNTKIEISFLRQINNVRLHLETRMSLYGQSYFDEPEGRRQTAEQRLQRFYSEHEELIHEALAPYMH